VDGIASGGSWIRVGCGCESDIPDAKNGMLKLGSVCVSAIVGNAADVVASVVVCEAYVNVGAGGCDMRSVVRWRRESSQQTVALDSCLS
jgi:hypothetical protein